MATMPSAIQYLPLSGGTITGPMTVTGLLTTQLGITNSGAGIASSSAISTSGLVGVVANGQLTSQLGNLDIQSAGTGVKVAEGSNAKQGTTGAMAAGSVTVANTSVTANSRIFVCRGAGGTNPGAWYVSAQTVGTSFVVTSTNAADTGNGVFEMFEPG